MPKVSFRGVALLLVIVGFVVVLIVRGPNEPKESEPAPSPTPTVTVTSTETSPDEVPATASADETQQAQLASRVVTLWQTQNVDERQKLLAPLVTRELLDLLQFTDPANVPTSPVASAEVTDQANQATGVTVTLQDGTRLIVTVADVYGQGQQLVTAISPA